jgi:peptidoglycan/xylan/chitin deacetylase (PgdA/CDA1 family)
MAVGAPALERILLGLLRRGCRFVGLDEVGPCGPPPGAVSITVDDGYASNLHHLTPLLLELGIPWSVFVSVESLGAANVWDVRWVGYPERHLTADEVRSLAMEGVTVGSHGMTHVALTSLSDRELADALGRSRAALAGITGVDVDAIAYPWGRVDARVADAARRAGYRRGFALRPARGLPQSLRGLAVPRTALYSPDQIPGVFAMTGPWAPRPLHAMRGAFARTGNALIGMALRSRRGA